MDEFRIKVFLTVLEEGSFTGASRSLGISQPAVSQNVADLEAELGCTLLDRTRRGEQRLTPEGEVFLRYAKSLSGAYGKISRLFGGKTLLRPERPVIVATNSMLRKEFLPGVLGDAAVVTGAEFLIREYDDETLSALEDADLVFWCEWSREGDAAFRGTVKYKVSDAFARTPLYEFLRTCYFPASLL